MDPTELLQSVIDTDDKLFQDVLSNSDTAIRQTLLGSPFKATGRALFMFYTKSNLLKNAVLSLCENEDGYSSRIVYRAFIEHFLKHRYLLFRFIETKSDEPGLDYYRYCMFEEGTRFLWGVEKSNQISRGESVKVRLDDEVSELLARDDYRDLTVEQIREKSRQFEYKSILSYLQEFHKQFTDIELPTFRWLVADYTELSSYVHGGPWAEDEMLHQGDDVQLQRNLFKLAKNTYNLNCVVDEGTFFAARLIDPALPDMRQVFEKFLFSDTELEKGQQ